MIPAALEACVEADVRAGFTPVMAVATLGTTGAGAIDPIQAMIPICRRHGLWVHADAAWAAAVCLSANLRHLCAGIGDADSVTWDAHKWLQVPMGAGMFFCQKPETVRRAFSIGTSYMPASVPGAVDGYDTSPQWSRRSIGLKVLAQVATMGDAGLEAMIDDMTEIGQFIRVKVTGAGWTVVNDTELPLVCFSHPEIDDGTVSIDDVLSHLYRRARVWVSIYRSSDGQRTLRACVTNAQTRERHVDTLISELETALDEARLSNR
jgi:glutamate/tyrosine decarboxylase-like PLP-dependent enzyme